MKNLAICFLILISLSGCQQQKIGFVDYVVITNEYQQSVDANAMSQTKLKSLTTRRDSIYSAFELEYRRFERRAPKMSKQTKTKKYQELQRKQQTIQQSVQITQQEIGQESQALTDSIRNIIKDFVKDYGKTNSFNYILGSNETGSVLYGEDTSDLTQEILKALNAAYAKN